MKLTPLHQGISVPNVEASVAWYKEVFGFEVVKDDIVPPLNSRIVFVEKDGFQLELFQYLGEDGKPLPPERREPNEDLKTCGTKHVAYAVEDMGALMARLEEVKADVVMGPFPMAGDLVCFIRDNSGILLELIQVGGHKEG